MKNYVNRMSIMKSSLELCKIPYTADDIDNFALKMDPFADFYQSENNTYFIYFENGECFEFSIGDPE